MSGLPETSESRKATPVFSGVLKYFPDALCEVAALSAAGNDKHNPGEPLHWAKEKSQDEDDALVRHVLNVAKGEVFDDASYPGKRIRHRAAVAWRALAGLQRELEAEAKLNNGPINKSVAKLYVPREGEIVRILEIAPFDDTPQHEIGQPYETRRAQICIEKAEGWIVFESVSGAETYCRVSKPIHTF